MSNRVSSYFPKDGHSATKTELKIIRTHVKSLLKKLENDTLAQKVCSILLLYVLKLKI